MMDLQTNRMKPWLRTVAFVTVFAFSFTSVLWADGTSLIPQQQRGEEILPSVSQRPQVGSVLLRQNLSQLVIPEAIGQIKRIHRGSSEHVVLHIQDAHINVDAQKNIAKLIQFFSKEYGLDLVNLEGASGRLFSEFYSVFPDKQVRKDVANYLLEEGRLTGPEYLSMVYRSSAELHGVEDDDLYEENRRAYLEVTRVKERSEAVLIELREVLNSVARFVFSEEVREFYKNREQFSLGAHELIRYVEYLISETKRLELNHVDMSGLTTLLELVEMEKSLDLELAQQDLSALVENVKTSLTGSDLSRFLTFSVQFKLKKVSRSKFYTYLNRLLEQEKLAELKAQHRSAQDYMEYVQTYENISLEVFDEIENLEKLLRSNLLKTEREIQLAELIQVWEVYEKMFSFALTKNDAEYYYQNQELFDSQNYRKFLQPLLAENHFSFSLPLNLSVLDEDIKKVEQFYRAALDRDKVLIQNTILNMKESRKPVSALVTGGFHTPGIEKYLKEHDYSYVVVMPKIKNAIDEQKENKLYDAALREIPLPVEQVLTDSYFQPVRSDLNDPRFQLQPKRLFIAMNKFKAMLFDPAYAKHRLPFDLMLVLGVLRSKTQKNAQGFIQNVTSNLSALLPQSLQYAATQVTSYVRYGYLETKQAEGASGEGEILWLPHLSAEDRIRAVVTQRSGSRDQNVEVARLLSAVRGNRPSVNLGDDELSFLDVSLDQVHISKDVLSHLSNARVQLENEISMARSESRPEDDGEDPLEAFLRQLSEEEGAVEKKSSEIESESVVQDEVGDSSEDEPIEIEVIEDDEDVLALALETYRRDAFQVVTNLENLLARVRGGEESAQHEFVSAYESFEVDYQKVLTELQAAVVQAGHPLDSLNVTVPIAETEEQINHRMTDIRFAVDEMDESDDVVAVDSVKGQVDSLDQVQAERDAAVQAVKNLEKVIETLRKDQEQYLRFGDIVNAKNVFLAGFVAIVLFIGVYFGNKVKLYVTTGRTTPEPVKAEVIEEILPEPSMLSRDNAEKIEALLATISELNEKLEQAGSSKDEIEAINKRINDLRFELMPREKNADGSYIDDPYTLDVPAEEAPQVVVVEKTNEAWDGLPPETLVDIEKYSPMERQKIWATLDLETRTRILREDPRYHQLLSPVEITSDDVVHLSPENFPISEKREGLTQKLMQETFGLPVDNEQSLYARDFYHKVLAPILLLSEQAGTSTSSDDDSGARMLRLLSSALPKVMEEDLAAYKNIENLDPYLPQYIREAFEPYLELKEWRALKPHWEKFRDEKGWPKVGLPAAIALAVQETQPKTTLLRFEPGLELDSSGAIVVTPTLPRNADGSIRRKEAERRSDYNRKLPSPALDLIIDRNRDFFSGSANFEDALRMATPGSKEWQLYMYANRSVVGVDSSFNRLFLTLNREETPAGQAVKEAKARISAILTQMEEFPTSIYFPQPYYTGSSAARDLNLDPRRFVPSTLGEGLNMKEELVTRYVTFWLQHPELWKGRESFDQIFDYEQMQRVLTDAFKIWNSGILQELNEPDFGKWFLNEFLAGLTEGKPMGVSPVTYLAAGADTNESIERLFAENRLYMDRYPSQLAQKVRPPFLRYWAFKENPSLASERYQRFNTLMYWLENVSMAKDYFVNMPLIMRANGVRMGHSLEQTQTILEAMNELRPAVEAFRGRPLKVFASENYQDAGILSAHGEEVVIKRDIPAILWEAVLMVAQAERAEGQMSAVEKEALEFINTVSGQNLEKLDFDNPKHIAFVLGQAIERTSKEAHDAKIALIEEIGIDVMLAKMNDFWSAFDVAVEKSYPDGKNYVSKTIVKNVFENSPQVQGRFMADLNEIATKGWEAYQKDRTRMAEEFKQYVETPELLEADLKSAYDFSKTRFRAVPEWRYHNRPFTVEMLAEDGEVQGTFFSWLRNQIQEDDQEMARSEARELPSRRQFIQGVAAGVIALGVSPLEAEEPKYVAETVQAMSGVDVGVEEILSPEESVISTMIPELKYKTTYVAFQTVPNPRSARWSDLLKEIISEGDNARELVIDAVILHEASKGQTVSREEVLRRYPYYSSQLLRDQDLQGTQVAWGLYRIGDAKTIEDARVAWEKTKGVSAKTAYFIGIPEFKKAVENFISQKNGRPADFTTPEDQGDLLGLAASVAILTMQGRDALLEEEVREVVRKINEMASIAGYFILGSGTERRVRSTDPKNPYAGSYAAEIYEKLMGKPFDPQDRRAMGWLNGELGFMAQLSGWETANPIEREEWKALSSAEKAKKRSVTLERAAENKTKEDVQTLLRWVTGNSTRALNAVENPADYGFLMNWVEMRADADWDSEFSQKMIERFRYLMEEKELPEQDLYKRYLSELGFSENFREELRQLYPIIEKKARNLELSSEERIQLDRYYELMGHVTFFTQYEPEELTAKLERNLKTLEILKNHFNSRYPDLDPSRSMFRGLVDLFSNLTFDRPIGEIDRMSARDYYELREMMHLLSAKPKYRAQNDLPSQAIVPAHVVAAEKEKFKSRFIESMLPGFDSMIEKHGDLETWLTNLEKILLALADYPIRLENTDPISNFKFVNFLDKLRSEGIPFTDNNKSKEIYESIFLQYQLMGLASWWLDQMLNSAEEQLTIEEVLRRISRKKALWNSYLTHWQTEELNVNITSAEISFLERLDLSPESYDQLFRVGASLQKWAKVHLGRQLFVDQVVYWIYSPGMYFSETVDPKRGGLSKLLSHLTGGRVSDEFIPSWRLEMTFKNVLPVDPDQRKYQIAMDSLDNERRRFLLWHGQRQLLRVLSEDDLIYWVNVMRRIKRGAGSRGFTGRRLNEGLVHSQIKNFMFMGHVVSEEVRKMALGAKLPFEDGKELFEDATNRRNYMILRLLTRRDRRVLTEKELELSPEALVHELMRERRKNLKIEDPKVWVEAVRAAVLSHKADYDFNGATPNENLKSLIKSIMLDTDTMIKEVKREFNYNFNQTEVMNVVIEQRVNGELHSIMNAEQKITRLYVDKFLMEDQPVQAGEEMIGDMSLTEAEKSLAPTALIEKWIVDFGLERTIVAERKEKWALMLKEKSLNFETVKSTFRELQMLRGIWAESRLQRNEETALEIVEEMLTLISLINRLGLDAYGVIEPIEKTEAEKTRVYKRDKRLFEEMMGADLRSDAEHQVYGIKSREINPDITDHQIHTEIEGDKGEYQRSRAFVVADRIFMTMAAVFSAFVVRFSYLMLRQRADRVHPTDSSKDAVRFAGKDEGYSDRTAVIKGVFDSPLEALVNLVTLSGAVTAAVMLAMQVMVPVAFLLSIILPIAYFGYYLAAKILRNRPQAPGERFTQGFSPLALQNLAYFGVVFTLAGLMGYHYIVAHLMATSLAEFAVPMMFAYTYLGLTTSHIIIDRLVTRIPKRRQVKSGEPQTIQEWQQKATELGDEAARVRAELENIYDQLNIKRSESRIELNKKRVELERKLQRIEEEEAVARFRAMSEDEIKEKGVPDGNQMSVFIITQNWKKGAFTNDTLGRDDNGSAIYNLRQSAQGNPGKNIPLSIKQTGNPPAKNVLGQVARTHELGEELGRRTYYYARANPVTEVNEGKKLLAFTEYQRLTGDGIIRAEVPAETVTNRYFNQDILKPAGFFGGVAAFLTSVGLQVALFQGIAVSAALTIMAPLGVALLTLLLTYGWLLYTSGGTTRDVRVKDKTEKGKDDETVAYERQYALSPETREAIAVDEVIYGDLAEIGFVGKDEEFQPGPKIYVSVDARERYEEILGVGATHYEYEYPVYTTNADKEAGNVAEIRKGRIPIVWDYDERIELDRSSPKRLWGDFVLDDKNIVGMIRDEAVAWMASKIGVQINGQEVTAEALQNDENREYVTNEIISFYDPHFKDNDSRERFRELLMSENPAIYAVYKAGLEMAENPFAAMGQPIYTISGKHQTYFSKVVNADAAVIGAFYAAASRFYSLGRANFTGKGPIIKDKWNRGTRELRQRVHMGFAKGGLFGTLLGGLATAAIAVQFGIPVLVGLGMILGFFLGAAFMGNYEMRLAGGAFGLVFHLELSHDYAEGSHSGAHQGATYSVQEGATGNLQAQVARAQFRWFQGVIPYVRHQFGPGTTLLDRWMMFLAQKMYLNDIIALNWMYGGLIALTISGIADRVYTLTRIQEFNINETFSEHWAEASEWFPFDLSFELTGFQMGFVTVGLQVALYLAFYAYAHMVGDESYKSQIKKNLIPWKLTPENIIFKLTANYFGTAILWGGLPMVGSLFFIAVVLMIYFSIFLGAQKGDPAGYASGRMRVGLVLTSTFIFLTLPFLTTRQALENLLRVLAGGDVPRNSTGGYKAELKQKAAIGASFVTMLGLSVAGAFLAITSGFGAATVGIAALIAVMAVPYYVSRSMGRYVPVMMFATALTVVGSIVTIFLLWSPGLLAALLAKTVLASSPLALTTVSYLIKIFGTVYLLQTIEKASAIVKEALPWGSFKAVASSSSTMTMKQASDMVSLAYYALGAVVLASILAWSHQWVFAWGVSFVVSWAMGWYGIWYTSQPLTWHPEAGQQSAENEAKSSFRPFKFSSVFFFWSAIFVSSAILLGLFFPVSVPAYLISIGSALVLAFVITSVKYLGGYRDGGLISGKRIGPSVISSLDIILGRQVNSLIDGVRSSSVNFSKSKNFQSFYNLYYSVVSFSSEMLFLMGLVVGTLMYGAVVIGIPIYLITLPDFYVPSPLPVGGSVRSLIEALPDAWRDFIFNAYTPAHTFFREYVTTIIPALILPVMSARTFAFLMKPADYIATIIDASVTAIVGDPMSKSKWMDEDEDERVTWKQKVLVAISVVTLLSAIGAGIFSLYALGQVVIAAVLASWIGLNFVIVFMVWMSVKLLDSNRKSPTDHRESTRTTGLKALLAATMVTLGFMGFFSSKKAGENLAVVEAEKVNVKKAEPLPAPQVEKGPLVFVEDGWQVVASIDTGGAPSDLYTHSDGKSFSELRFFFQDQQIVTIKGNGFIRLSFPNTDWGTSLLTPGYWTKDDFYHHKLNFEVSQQNTYEYNSLDGALTIRGRFVDVDGNIASDDVVIKMHPTQINEENPKNDLIQLDVTFTLKAKKLFSLSDSDDREDEALKLFQFSSNFVTDEVNDVSRMIVTDGEGKELRNFIPSKAEQLFDAVNLAAAPLTLSLEGNLERGKPSVAVTINKLTVAEVEGEPKISVQGWHDPAVSDDPYEQEAIDADDIGAWLAVKPGSPEFSAGETIVQVDLTAKATRAKQVQLEEVVVQKPVTEAIDEVVVQEETLAQGVESTDQGAIVDSETPEARSEARSEEVFGDETTREALYLALDETTGMTREIDLTTQVLAINRTLDIDEAFRDTIERTLGTKLYPASDQGYILVEVHSDNLENEVNAIRKMIAGGVPAGVRLIPYIEFGVSESQRVKSAAMLKAALRDAMNANQVAFVDSIVSVASLEKFIHDKQDEMGHDRVDDRGFIQLRGEHVKKRVGQERFQAVLQVASSMSSGNIVEVGLDQKLKGAQEVQVVKAFQVYLAAARAIAQSA